MVISFMFSIIAERLSEMIFFGSDVNHAGAYIKNHKLLIIKSNPHIIKRFFLFFLKYVCCTIKKVMIDNANKTTIILMIIHEKFPREGLINWFISKIESLLWKKYIVKVSRTNSKNIPDIIRLFMILINIFLPKHLSLRDPVRPDTPKNHWQNILNNEK